MTHPIKEELFIIDYQCLIKPIDCTMSKDMEEVHKRLSKLKEEIGFSLMIPKTFFGEDKQKL